MYIRISKTFTYMKASIGRIVIYNTTEKEREEAHESQDCNVQGQLPAIITAVWSDECVNLKVIKDGQGSDWVTSSPKGDLPGNWNWPERV